MKTNENTDKLVLSAMMICLIIVSTFLFKIPVPATQGYIHLGDSMIFLALLFLGWKNGAIVSGLGTFIADLLGGFAIFAPWSFLINSLMVLVIAFFVYLAMKTRSKKSHERTRRTFFYLFLSLGAFFGMALMTIGYFLVEWVLYGNFAIAFLSVPWNIAQFVVGAILSIILAIALHKTPTRKLFYYDFSPSK